MISSDAPLLNLLVSYPYMRDEIVSIVQREQQRIRFVLDSGAFTAWKGGRAISLDDYCAFIESLPFNPWRYFSLDVVGDPDATMRNYLTMLERGFTPVPIFTRGDDPAVVEEYYATSDVLGIGGLVGTSKNHQYVNGIMQVIGSRRVHWLGFVRHPYVLHYRPYMCDSSNWEGAARYGSLRVYAGLGRFIALNRKSFTSRPAPAVQQALSRYGLSSRDLAQASAWTGEASLIRALSARSSVAYSHDCQKNLGSHVFSAAITPVAVGLLVAAQKQLEDPS